MSWKRIVTLAAFAAVAISGASACSSEDTKAAPGTESTGSGRELATKEKGAEAVVKRKCTLCHGDNMAGATKALVIPGETPDPRVELYPPNLTPDIETGLGDPNITDPAKRGYTDESLARAIREGYDRNDLVLCPQMKHFSEMSDCEVYSIVAYLRSLPPVKQKILRSVCPPLKSKEEQSR